MGDSKKTHALLTFTSPEFLNVSFACRKNEATMIVQQCQVIVARTSQNLIAHARTSVFLA